MTEPTPTRTPTQVPTQMSTQVEALVTALADLPVARACGVTPALAADVRTVSSGGVPRLRLTLVGWSAGARQLRERARAALPDASVDWSATAVDAHLLWYVVPDPRQDAGPTPPGPRLNTLLTGPAAPAAVLVVAADDDWRGLGLDSVAGWCRNRTASWPAPWPTVPVRAVVPAWFEDRPSQSGLAPLLRDVLDRADDTADEPLSVALTRRRLVPALRLLLHQLAPDPTDPASVPPNPAEAWRRCHTLAALAPARRLHRRLATAADLPSPTASPSRQTSPWTERP
ncbi:hypothetical protein [Streptacidiphilus anmyonensis]|uniref:hypothetical protein n=1 Tax=Streptacidiphilus anmyonensis TaxID=405782 RepID=UPI0005A957C5|nr:hypothetical protein [Streptacidiphilus anmyonensis]